MIQCVCLCVCVKRHSYIRQLLLAVYGERLSRSFLEFRQPVDVGQGLRWEFLLGGPYVVCFGIASCLDTVLICISLPDLLLPL